MRFSARIHKRCPRMHMVACTTEGKIRALYSHKVKVKLAHLGIALFGFFNRTPAPTIAPYSVTSI